MSSPRSNDGGPAARRRRGDPLPAALVDPHPKRLDTGDTERIIRAHRQAVTDGADGYVDSMTGLFCFTAAYHWEKGSCCEMGCRHCPWVDAARRLEG